MRNITTTVYKFSELSDEAKEKAIANLSSINVDYDSWSEGVIEDATTIGKIIGIDIDKIYFSGFSSQGDGACFSGSYSYEKNSVKAIKEHAPCDMELHRIATDLQRLQSKAFYRLYANVKHTGHYYHELCTSIDVNNDYQELTANHESDLSELLRDFMKWIYGQLHKEYDYNTSDAAIIETIEANEYEFTENGKLV